MKKFFVSLLVIFGIFVSLLLVAANFSEKTTRYSCTGEYENEGKISSGQVFLKVSIYRWWVSLWSSDSDGNAMIDFVSIDANTGSSDNYVSYYPDIDLSGDNVLFTDSRNLPGGILFGLSGRLRIKSGYGYFEGTCSRNG